MKKNGILRHVLLIAYFVLLLLFLSVCLVGSSLLDWFTRTLGSISVESVIYTLKSPLKGTDKSIVNGIISSCAPSALCVAAVFLFLIMLVLSGRVLASYIVISIKNRKKVRQLKIGIIPLMFAAALIVSAAGACYVFVKADEKLSVTSYLKRLNDSTTIYEDYYVDPDSVTIRAENPKNLIYIYAESMEFSYADKQNGGVQDEVNYIPGLTELANDNISFRSGGETGGFRCLPGCDWTIAGMFSSQAGIPFAFPVGGNADFTDREAFAKGTVMLGDILNRNGYVQEFLCGSDATFGGRRIMLEQHGGYSIRDVYYALDNGYISEAYGWGFLDHTLFDIAQDRLTDLASSDTPFNLTILTIDTHFPDGYTCELCEDRYDEQFANVVSCSDARIAAFVEWCQEQPWFEDTVIVIQGDHPFMGTYLSGGLDMKDRQIYNCFINVDADAVRTDRDFTHLDMLPTVLSAVGFEIEGDRLGLGTDLFSGTPTLCEQLGFDYLYEELSKSSRFYENFY